MSKTPIRIIKKGNWQAAPGEQTDPLQLQNFTDGRIPKQFVAESFTDETNPPADLKHVRIIRSAQARNVAQKIDIETSYYAGRKKVDLLEESFLEDLFFEGHPENEDGNVDDKTDEPEQNEPAEVVLTLEEQKAVWLTEWQNEQVEKNEKIEADAYQKGYDEAVATETEKLKETQELFKTGLANLNEDWKRFLRESEPLLGQFAFKIAELAIESPINEKVRQISREMLFEAIHELGTTQMIEVHVHPVDFLAMQEAGIADNKASSFDMIRWESDPTLKPGEWSATSFNGAIRRVMSERIENLRQQFGFDLYEED